LDDVFITLKDIHHKMTLNSPLTVVSLMNGMIGGVILVLPVAAYQAGYLYTILAITISGGFSYYSCYLSVKHLGDQKDMNYSMQAHFRTPVAKILYDIVVWLGLLFGSMFYYGLICIQWQSILGKDTIDIPLANAAALFLLIFLLKYFDFGASLMAYGIISIIAYMTFLIWVVSTAPSG
jgi:amino acid permease